MHIVIRIRSSKCAMTSIDDPGSRPFTLAFLIARFMAELRFRHYLGRLNSKLYQRILTNDVKTH